jgi:phosphoserine phosphatase RsbU/P
MDSAAYVLPQDNLSLEQQIVRLQALLEATRQIHSTIAVEEVLEQTARVLVRELEMDGALFLEPVNKEIRVGFGRMPDSPFLGCHRFPLLSREEKPLAELVVSHADGCELSIYERDFIEGLVLQAAVALENAMLHERDLEWARVQQDLNAARSIQRSLLPASMPRLPGFSIDARSSACYEVGGDYVDVFQREDGSYLMVVADVAGKGLASAIVATSFRASLRALASQPLPLAELAARIGQHHWEEGSEARRRYVTAIFVHLRADHDEVEIVNAGHNPGAIVLPDGSTRLVEASGTPLGMLPGMSYAAEQIAFLPGSRLLFYTDGLTEVYQGEEEFGMERLVTAFEAERSMDATLVLASLWETLALFSANAPQVDDMTALAICHLDSTSREFATP